ncbi:MAG: polysaccharide pyruvyl transferase family protein [Planctomycetota bacterium]
MKILIDHGTPDARNFGDLAMIQALVHTLRKAEPDCELGLLAQTPSAFPEHVGEEITIYNTETYWPLKNFPVAPLRLPSWLRHMIYLWSRGSVQRQCRLRSSARRRRCRPSVQQLMHDEGFDGLAIAGGSVISHTFLGFTELLFNELLAAHRQGLATAIFGAGIGPVDHALLLQWCRQVVPELTYLGSRECAQYQEMLDGMKAGSFGEVTGDLALAHPKLTGQPAKAQPLGDLIGINVRATYYSKIEGSAADDLGQALRSVADRTGMKPCLIPINRHAEEGDHRSVGRLMGWPKNADGLLGLVSTVDDLLDRIKHCRLVISGSYHACVFALALGVPCVAVIASDYYQHKMVGLFEMFGLQPSTVDMRQADFVQRLHQEVDRYQTVNDKQRQGWIERAREQAELVEAGVRRFVGAST